MPQSDYSGRLVRRPGTLVLVRGEMGRYTPQRRGSRWKCCWVASLSCVVLFGSRADARTTGPSRATVDAIIVHTTGGPECRKGQVDFGTAGTVNSMKSYFEQHAELGIHYLVGRDGQVAKSIPEGQVANHAIGWNERSIGVELINKGDGKDPFPEAQIGALVGLIKEIRQRHRIDIANIKGHTEVDQRTFECGGKKVKTKQDPGPLFPWDRVRHGVR